MVSFQSTRKQEQTDRAAMIRDVKPADLFNRAHAHNYLVSILIGRAPKAKDNNYLDTTIRTLTPLLSRGRRKNGSLSPKRDPRKHTRKDRKGSSSGHMSKRYNTHLVEDTLQSAFLFYWENRETKEYLQHIDHGEKTIRERFAARQESSKRITRLCCRAELLATFKQGRIESAKGARAGQENKFKHSPSSFAALKNNDDMLSAETICDILAEKLANGCPKTARIVRATMAKTNKKKCLARALKCSRPTLDARLGQLSLESELTKKQTVSFLSPSPIGKAPLTYKPVATVPALPLPVALPLLSPWSKQEQEETRALSLIIRARLQEQANRATWKQEQEERAGLPVVDRTDEYARGNYIRAIFAYRKL